MTLLAKRAGTLAVTIQKAHQHTLLSSSSAHIENWGESTMADTSPWTDTSTDVDTDEKYQTVVFFLQHCYSYGVYCLALRYSYHFAGNLIFCGLYFIYLIYDSDLHGLLHCDRLMIMISIQEYYTGPPKYSYGVLYVLRVYWYILAWSMINSCCTQGCKFQQHGLIQQVVEFKRWILCGAVKWHSLSFHCHLVELKCLKTLVHLFSSQNWDDL